MTVGIFISMEARASCEKKIGFRFGEPLTDGKLNPKYPGGIEYQKEKLEAEGHTFITKGHKNIRYFVEIMINYYMIWNKTINNEIS